jgi:predicted amidophosphoribosyltransferase
VRKSRHSSNDFVGIRHTPAMTGVCPDCGSPLPEDVALQGLCPQCLLSMALEDDENPTLYGSSPGGILGERY